MSEYAPLLLCEGNDETLTVSLVADTDGDDLSLITELRAVFKPDPTTADLAAGVVTLTSLEPTEITITAQTTTGLVAEVSLPLALTTTSPARFWRLDAYVSDRCRTAAHGPVTLINL